MDTLPRELVIQNILRRAPQLGLAWKELYEHLPKIAPDQKSNIRFPSPQNRNPVQIKNGMIVRLNKDGTIKSILGKYGESKNDKQK